MQRRACRLWLLSWSFPSLNLSRPFLLFGIPAGIPRRHNSDASAMSPQPSSGEVMGRTMVAVGAAGVLAVWLGIQCHSVAAEERLMLKAGISDSVNTVLAWYVARD